MLTLLLIVTINISFLYGERVDMTNKCIDTIEFDNLSDSVDIIDLSFNRIKRLDENSKLPKQLQALFLSDNPLQIIDGSHVNWPSSLTELHLFGTNIRSMTGIPTSVSILTLSGSITSEMLSNGQISLSDTNIKELHLSFNPIQQIDGNTLPQSLITLALRYTEIRSLTNLPNSIITLYLENSEIKTLNDIELPSLLQYLYLFGNPLENIGDVIFPHTINEIYLPDIVNGIKVDINHPIISELISKLQHVKRCIVYEASYVYDQDGELMKDEVFVIEYGKITIKSKVDTINQKQFPDFVHTMDLSNTSQLITLYLSRSKIRSIVDLPETVSDLYMEYCGLTESILASDTLKIAGSNIQSLHLEENNIATLNGVRLPKTLRYLDLDKNPLKYIGDARFPVTINKIYLPDTVNNQKVNIGHPIILELINKLENALKCTVYTVESVDSLLIRDIFEIHASNSVTSLKLLTPGISSEMLATEQLSFVRTNIDILYLSTIHTVKLNGNVLPSRLSELYLDHTNIRSITNLPNSIHFMDLTHNELQTLNGFELPSGLKCLRLFGNPLENIGNVVFPVTINEIYLPNILNKKTVDMNHPIIIELVSKLKDVKDCTIYACSTQSDKHEIFVYRDGQINIKCDMNAIHLGDLPDFVHTIEIDKTTITVLDKYTQLPSTLKYLIFNYNHYGLKCIDDSFVWPTLLEYLSLYWTDITSIKIIPPSLTRLSLSNAITSELLHKQDTSIPLLNTNIKRLFLSNNQIEYLNGNILPKTLNTLSLSRNKIRSIMNLPDNVNEIYLEHCDITTEMLISDTLNIFNAKSKIKRLHLDGNRIKTLDKAILPSKLSYLDLDQNPLEHIGNVRFPDTMTYIYIPNIINGYEVTINHPLISELIPKLKNAVGCTVMSCYHGSGGLVTEEIFEIVEYGKVKLPNCEDYTPALNYELNSVRWLKANQRYNWHSALIIEFKAPSSPHFLSVLFDATNAGDDKPININGQQFIGNWQAVLPYLNKYVVGSEYKLRNVWSTGSSFKYREFGHFVNNLVTKQMSYNLENNNCHHVAHEVYLGLTGECKTIPDSKKMDLLHIVPAIHRKPSVMRLNDKTRSIDKIYVWKTAEATSQLKEKYNMKTFMDGVRDYKFSSKLDIVKDTARRTVELLPK